MAHLNNFHPSNNDFIRLGVLVIILSVVIGMALNNANDIINFFQNLN
jgi:hypothetical protein